MMSADWRTRTMSRWLLRARPRPVGSPAWAVAIYKADRLGDFVLALGAIRRLAAVVGERRTVLVITRAAESLAAREFPEVDRVIVDPCRSGVGAAAWELWQRRGEALFRHGVRDLVCLRHHRLPAESVVAGRIPAAVAWGTENTLLSGDAGRLARLPLDRVIESATAAPGECLDLARHRAVVGAFLGRRIEAVDLAPRLEPGWSLATSKPVVAVSPFGSASIRDIPMPLLVAVGRYLREVHGLKLNLLCPPAEEARHGRLARRLAEEGLEGTSVLRCANVDALREALRESRLVLSAETGTAHMATALDAPMVGFLGGGHLGWFAPWFRSGRQRWITAAVPCAGCRWRCIQSAPVCLTGIAETQLVAAVDAALAEG